MHLNHDGNDCSPEREVPGALSLEALEHQVVQDIIEAGLPIRLQFTGKYCMGHLGLRPQPVMDLLQRKGYSGWPAFIHQLRMKKAAGMLSRPERPKCNLIAYELGYSSPGHFTRAFRTYFGVSPLQYRQRMLGNRRGQTEQ